MHSIKINEERMKILVEYDNKGQTMRGMDAITIHEISDKYLFFSDLVDSGIVARITQIELYLKVSAQWKKYLLKNIEPITKDSKMVDGLSYEIPGEQSNDFRMDFSLARC